MAAALAVHACAVLVLWVVPRRPPPVFERGWAVPGRASPEERLRYLAMEAAPGASGRPRGKSATRTVTVPAASRAIAVPAAVVASAPPESPSPGPPTREEAAVPPGGGAGASGVGGDGQGKGTGDGSGDGTRGGAGTPPAKRGARIANNLLIGVDAPASVRPFQLKVVFEVDSLGRARILSATHTRDGGYNRTLMAELAQIRFHPATRVDGTAVTDTVPLEWDF